MMRLIPQSPLQSKVKQHQSRSVLGTDFLLYGSMKGPSERRRAVLIKLCHRQGLYVKKDRRAAKVGEQFPPWRIKTVIACLRTILWNDSQIVGNSPLHSSSPTLTAFNQPVNLWNKHFPFF